jgi:hypothetical protein
MHGLGSGCHSAAVTGSPYLTSGGPVTGYSPGEVPSLHFMVLSARDDRKVAYNAPPVFGRLHDCLQLGPVSPGGLTLAEMPLSEPCGAEHRRSPIQ